MITKGIIYYTDNKLNLKIAHSVQKQLKKISIEKNIPIVCSSLKKMSFGDINIHFPHLKRGYLTMFKQILGALEASTSDVVFFCEHDVFYHPSHFDFEPSKSDVYYYNTNVWKVRNSDGFAVKYDNCMQLSGLVANRGLLIGHYKRRIAKILQNQKDILASGKELKNDGFSKHMGFEPGLHSYPRGVDEYKTECFMSPFPNIDIRHDGNLTKTRWSKEEFNKNTVVTGWFESNLKNIYEHTNF